MSIDAYTSVVTRPSLIPQSEAASPLQIENSAGGFSFTVDKWKRLERFLILGSENGNYYASEQKLTKESAASLTECITEDGLRVVNTIEAISASGRAHKNDPALFALAMCSSAEDVRTRKAAIAALPKVARISTHLYNFVAFVKQFRGQGRIIKGGIGDWYNDKSLSDLGNQVVKYQSRNGWSHRDLLRLGHPKTDDAARNEIYSWVVGKSTNVSDTTSIIYGFELAKKASTENEIIRLIGEYNLPRECVPTHFLNSAKVWDALLVSMPMTAMIRNLNKMTETGLVVAGSDATRVIADRLRDNDFLKKSKIHPMTVLIASKTYGLGHGIKGSLKWKPVQTVMDGLDDAFYGTFGNVTPTGKRIVVGLDVSGSMSSSMAGVISCSEGATAMALINAHVENNVEIMGFTGTFVDLKISKKDRLDTAIAKVSHLQFGRTDCALPMMWALGYNRLDDNSWVMGGNSGYHKTAAPVVKADAFIIYTDNETWYGKIHPHEALKKYRDATGIPAKLVVCAMAVNDFTIADPKDAGMMDCVGFDSATPEVISSFISE
jgi:60 kDa SS-A/Ro ribonucleoprotein